MVYLKAHCLDRLRKSLLSLSHYNRPSGESNWVLFQQTPRTLPLLQYVRLRISPGKEWEIQVENLDHSELTFVARKVASYEASYIDRFSVIISVG